MTTPRYSDGRDVTLDERREASLRWKEEVAAKLTGIREGMSRNDVLQILSEVNRKPFSGGLQIMPPDRLSNLRERLSDPINLKEAQVLREVVDKLQLVSVFNESSPRETIFMQPYIDTFVQRLNRASMTWEEFETWYQDMRLEKCLAEIVEGKHPFASYGDLRGRWRERARSAFIERGYFPWKDVEASRKRQHRVTQAPISEYGLCKAGPCPRCGRPVEQLTWIFYAGPPRHDRSWLYSDPTNGWLSICDPCHLQIDFFDRQGK